MDDKQGKDQQSENSVENGSFQMSLLLNFDNHQFSGTSHANNALEMGQASEWSEQLPQLLETSEPERATKNDKCNMRQSLAWDSAFFTSAGVLDAEELSTIIEGGEKGVKHLLRGIQEDLHTSVESISTFESDNLTLESLEAELFEDIRASIQKSCWTSNLATLSSNAAPGGTNSQAKASASKKVDIAAGNRPTLKSDGKIQNNAITESVKMKKQSRNSPQVTQPVMRIRESTSSVPRTTKSRSKVDPLPTVAAKRTSLSTNHFKVENANSTSVAASLKGTQESKLTSLGGSRRGLPKSSSSSTTSNPSLLGSSTASKTESMRPSSSCSSSGSSSSIRKSETSSVRKNYSKVNSSSQILKTPSKSAVKSKIPTPTSSLSSRVVSSKISLKISPASSISEWSVESSSSTTTVTQKSTSRASLDASSSCRSSNGDLDMNLHSSDKTSDRVKNQRSDVSSLNFKKAAVQTSSLSRPDSVKPSGLRMPSPKIGFFDGSNSIRNPKGGMQSQARLSTCFSKLGAGLSSPIGGSNKVKSGIISPTEVLKAITKMKTDTQGSAALVSSSAKVSTASKDAKKNRVKSPVNQIEIQREEPATNSRPPLTVRNFTEVRKEVPAANSIPVTEKKSIHIMDMSNISKGSRIKVVEMTADLMSSKIAQKENI